MFLQRLFFYAIVYAGVELTLLLMLASYTSWEVPLLVIFGTALLGAIVLRLAKGHFVAAIVLRLRAGAFPGRELTDGTLVAIGGALLILPGLLGDLLGLLLLLPPVRWLIVARFRRRYGDRSQGVTRVTVYSTTDDLPPRQRILDAESVDASADDENTR